MSNSGTDIYNRESAHTTESVILHNCSYRYDYDPSDHTIWLASLILDGPLTLFAAVLSLVGAHFAIRFLGQAGLNRDLTAGKKQPSKLKRVISYLPCFSTVYALRL